MTRLTTLVSASGELRVRSKKNPWFCGGNQDKKDKWGAYRSEENDFNHVASLSIVRGTKTLEADLMDWSDDITYSVHDIDDFYRAGQIPMHLLADRRYGKERERFFTLVYARHPDRVGIWRDRVALEEAFIGLVADLFPLESAYSGTWQERAALRDFTSQLIGRFVGATTLEISNDRCVLRRDPNVELEVAMLKELTWVYVIEAASLASQQAGQRRVIRRLFELFEEAVHKQRYHLFAPYYRHEILGAADDKMRRRILIDMIAGMTESQATAMFKRLLGVDVGFGLHEYM